MGVTLKFSIGIIVYQVYPPGNVVSSIVKPIFAWRNEPLSLAR